MRSSDDILRVIGAFQRYGKLGERSLIESFSVEELERAWAFASNSDDLPHKLIKLRIDELKKSQPANVDTPRSPEEADASRQEELGRAILDTFAGQKALPGQALPTAVLFNAFVDRELGSYQEIEQGAAWIKQQGYITPASSFDVGYTLTKAGFEAIMGDSSAASSLCVFVSHASEDEAFVRALVDLLQKALGLSPKEILCTSLSGYGMPSGADTSTALREYIKKTTVVLGVLSASSRHSDWVSFELGAAWGMDRKTIPILLRLDYEALPDPLKGKTAVRASEQGKILEMLSTLEKELGRTLVTPAAYMPSVNTVTSIASQATHSNTSEPVADESQAEQAETRSRNGLLAYQQRKILSMLKVLPASFDAVSLGKCPIWNEEDEIKLIKLASAANPLAAEAVDFAAPALSWIRDIHARVRAALPEVKPRPGRDYDLYEQNRRAAVNHLEQIEVYTRRKPSDSQGSAAPTAKS